MRGQANLLSVAAAVVVLTAATGVGVAFADAAFADADRNPEDRRAARTLADRLVAADAPTTDRRNALREERVRNLTAARVDALAPTVEGASVRVRLGNETVFSRGRVADGWTVRRVVRAGEAVRRTRTVNLSSRRTASVPAGVGRATVAVEPGAGTRVRTVRADDRVVVHDPAGVSGESEVRLDRSETTTLRVAAGDNATGRSVVAYRALRARPTTLEVTVDA